MALSVKASCALCLWMGMLLLFAPPAYAKRPTEAPSVPKAPDSPLSPAAATT